MLCSSSSAGRHLARVSSKSTRHPLRLRPLGLAPFFGWPGSTAQQDVTTAVQKSQDAWHGAMTSSWTVATTTSSNFRRST